MLFRASCSSCSKCGNLSHVGQLFLVCRDALEARLVFASTDVLLRHVSWACISHTPQGAWLGTKRQGFARHAMACKPTDTDKRSTLTTTSLHIIRLTLCVGDANSLQGDDHTSLTPVGIVNVDTDTTISSAPKTDMLISALMICAFVLQMLAYNLKLLHQHNCPSYVLSAPRAE